MTIEQILKLGEELGKVRGLMYINLDREAIEHLKMWLQYDATTHNVKEFGKWLQEIEAKYSKKS